MYKKYPFLAAIVALASTLSAQQITITIPRHSELTPVQRLNREGVEEVVKHKYEKAEALFLKAYLYDPADPFTLNNLGYVAELQGQIDRAADYYKLAIEQGSQAVIDRSSDKKLKGKPMIDALGTIKNMPMRINAINIYAIQLLSKNRAFEAEAVLKQLLPMDPNDPFTLNNLGVAEEGIGDLPEALKYYDAAAATRSKRPVVVALKHSSRGKPISEVAADSAAELRMNMATMDLQQIRADMFAVRGVAALNKNDWAEARKDFQQSYAADPSSAFALNNLGYLAEHDGELETAMSYYARARRGPDADATIGMATRPRAQGQRLETVAQDNHHGVDMELKSQPRPEAPAGPVELLRRDGSSEPATNSPEQPHTKAGDLPPVTPAP